MAPCTTQRTTLQKNGDPYARSIIDAVRLCIEDECRVVIHGSDVLIKESHELDDVLIY